jgi:hypothetical protein
MDVNEVHTVGRRAALRRLGGLTAAGVVGATAATLLPGQLAGAQTATGLVFHPISPYRAVDTRRQGEAGRLVSGFTVEHNLRSDVDGKEMIPVSADARAVTYNLTVTQTIGNGYLAVFPGGTTWGGISSINWTVSGADIANGGTVGLGTTGTVHVTCGGFASTFFIIDVTGYYSPAVPV